ncbi:hypothetical protein [Sulfitobacter donghicola]|uniref:Uncharacterized protein n=1 Tax=Sulfitobacter donghicola DSW-25 = KCTC 12864 = JCM 14565 TaxID=1300350 RepID=A0A073IQX5_9RHOB|nr:hypothetical protein [Sulfitobacter donghicola]KEJ87807.1 hypothetical protein DSW25_05060 [Sulfitobacter donghicola DSW-25 = KCTC 12864 = JCM 14565]KIN68336.1 hypothetical protein Z948_2066 [Sulfitobacter donghicola DSW-25 = KCTC 12864 = JCM 14565]
MTDATTNPTDKTPASELDESSLSAIRSILTEDAAAPAQEPSPREQARIERATAGHAPRSATRATKKSDRLPLLADAESDPAAAARAQELLAPKVKKRRFSLGRKAAAPTKVEPVQQPVAEPKRRQVVPAEGLIDRIKAYRPTPAHMAIGAILLLVLFRPWLVFGLLFLFALIMVGVFLILGYDGFWQSVMKISRWYANRRPERAAAMHQRLDRFAVRWDAILDRFPEGTVDGLYLPDFGELASADSRHDKAMERRLDGLQKEGG